MRKAFFRSLLGTSKHLGRWLPHSNPRSAHFPHKAQYSRRIWQLREVQPQHPARETAAGPSDTREPFVALVFPIAASAAGEEIYFGQIFYVFVTQFHR